MLHDGMSHSAHRARTARLFKIVALVPRSARMLMEAGVPLFALLFEVPIERERTAAREHEHAQEEQYQQSEFESLPAREQALGQVYEKYRTEQDRDLRQRCKARDEADGEQEPTSDVCEWDVVRHDGHHEVHLA